MSKQKEIKISYSIVDNHVENASFDGDVKEFIAVMSSGRQEFVDVSINAALHYYLMQPSREQALARFLDAAAEFDEKILNEHIKPDSYDC